MWELDYKESWALKNWCFWTVVLEKTLESPLDCKEIQPVHSEGDQSWVFFVRKNAKPEIPVLWCSAFFTVQLSHSYMTAGKTIALTRWTLVGKVISLLFNMLSRLIIVFLPRSKSFNFMAAVTICSDFRAQENKISHCFPIYLLWSDGTRFHDLSFLNVEF